MATYLESTKIEVFPTSIERPGFPYARVLTEDHILDMIRSAAPAESYVLTDTYSNTAPLEFVINGYYVKVNATFSSRHSFGGNNVYAHIFIDTTSPTHPQLYGTDTGTSFTAVAFTDSATLAVPNGLTNYEHHVLHLLQKSGNTFSIPLTSRKCVDGGEIE